MRFSNLGSHKNGSSYRYQSKHSRISIGSWKYSNLGRGYNRPSRNIDLFKASDYLPGGKKYSYGSSLGDQYGQRSLKTRQNAFDFNSGSLSNQRLQRRSRGQSAHHVARNRASHLDTTPSALDLTLKRNHSISVLSNQSNKSGSRKYQK